MRCLQQGCARSESLWMEDLEHVFRETYSTVEHVKGKTEAQELLESNCFVSNAHRDLTTETNSQLSELPSQDL